MVVLIVSRKSMSELILSKIAKHVDIANAIDYYKLHKDGYRESKEVIAEAKRVKADSAIVVANFKLACELLSSGCKTIIVLIPLMVDHAEIVKAQVFKLTGKLELEKL